MKWRADWICNVNSQCSAKAPTLNSYKIPRCPHHLPHNSKDSAGAGHGMFKSFLCIAYSCTSEDWVTSCEGCHSFWIIKSNVYTAGPSARSELYPVFVFVGMSVRSEFAAELYTPGPVLGIRAWLRTVANRPCGLHVLWIPYNCKKYTFANQILS